VTVTRASYPEGVPCWSDTGHPDPAAVVDFYRGVFGWALDDRMPPEAPGHYFMATLDGALVAAIGSRPDDAPPGAPCTTSSAVARADDAAARVVAAGGRVDAGPTDVFAAGRMAMCTDPVGATFGVWQAGEHVGAQLVNVAGTWNFSNLETDDSTRALAFYGEVFGWEADAMGDSWLLRKPGYGEFLASIDPEVRARHADGVPSGFSDAVAWIVTGEAGAPARWTVTFAVDDTDATVTRATELGGEVVIAPYNAPPVRAAVLRDPQGASFTVSRFYPEQLGSF
jgi:predicted enzyme related to lactoylglutathione lyase